VTLYFQFFFGWWLAIDAAACYTDKKQLMDVFHICGVFATISMFMINGVSSASLENPDSYTDGCLGVRGARIWFFFGCLMGFGSLIGASYILFGEYIALCKASTYLSKIQLCSAWTSLYKDDHLQAYQITILIPTYFSFAANKETFHPDKTYPGVAIFLQNLFIMMASLTFKFGRSEELYG
jgi:hypothetical protein